MNGKTHRLVTEMAIQYLENLTPNFTLNGKKVKDYSQSIQQKNSDTDKIQSGEQCRAFINIYKTSFSKIFIYAWIPPKNWNTPRSPCVNYLFVDTALKCFVLKSKIKLIVS